MRVPAPSACLHSPQAARGMLKGKMRWDGGVRESRDDGRGSWGHCQGLGWVGDLGLWWGRGVGLETPVCAESGPGCPGVLYKRGWESSPRWGHSSPPPPAMPLISALHHQTPHLVNLNEDPLMSECLLYHIKDGITR